MGNGSFNILLLTLAVFWLFSISSCTQSDAQREFEDLAFQPPENITEMTDGGRMVSNASDPDDWRSSPMYRGLVEVATPAYPNPVNVNTQLIIEVENKGFETLSGLEVYVFKESFRNQVGPLFSMDGSTIQTGLITISLSPAQFGDGTQASGLYRIIIYDGRQNVFTYGDVEVL